jgi:hypothetical protein
VTGFDSAYHKNNVIDYDSVNKGGETFRKHGYQSKFTPKTVDMQNPQGQQQQQPKPEPSRASIRAEVEQYKKSLHDAVLAPMLNIYNKRVQMYQAQGLQMPQDEFALYDAEYREKQAELESLANAKFDELSDKFISDREAQITDGEVVRKSIETYTSVSRELLPNLPPDQAKERLDNLIFGYQTGRTVNGHPEFVRGYGADFVEHLFDMVHEGKEFSTHDERNAAMEKWWAKYATNPNNVRYVARVAWDNFEATNKPKYRDAMRAQWDEEQRNKNLSKTKPTGSPMAGVGAQDVDDVQKQLDAYFSPPKMNM